MCLFTETVSIQLTRSSRDALFFRIFQHSFFRVSSIPFSVVCVMCIIWIWVQFIVRIHTHVYDIAYGIVISCDVFIIIISIWTLDTNTNVHHIDRITANSAFNTLFLLAIFSFVTTDWWTWTVCCCCLFVIYSSYHTNRCEL